MGTCHAPGNVARFRCTEKLRKELGITLHDGMAPDVLPLGDWYCTLFFVDRRKCLLFTSSTTLFSVLVPGVRRADLANLGGLFRSEARRALSDAGCPPEAIVEALGLRMADLMPQKAVTREASEKGRSGLYSSTKSLGSISLKNGSDQTFDAQPGFAGEKSSQEIFPPQSRPDSPFSGRPPIKLMPTYHPAALLRNEPWKKDAYRDLLAIRARYEELTGGTNAGNL